MKELCRNFQRGSCTYGERCRFLHQQPNQQQRKSNAFGGQTNSYQQPNKNPFGFGSAAASAPNQQQKNNPFGFGSQNASQSNGAPKSNQFQPFENKWSRTSSKPQNGTQRPSDNNSQTVNHKCTDPEVCKRQIAEDFEQENPLWILTCYGHCKGAPCDIIGDISYEELRASAYEDAKNGMSLPLIVEKERNILKSKLVEFDKLLSEPYKMPLNSSLDIQKYQSNGGNVNAFSQATQNNSPLSVSSFSQLGASLNTGFERPSAPLVTPPAQPNSFGSGGNLFTSNTGNLFGSVISGAQNNTGNSFTSNTGNQFGSGISGAQNNTGNAFTSNTGNIFGSGVSGAQNNNPFSTPATMFPGSTSQFQQPSIAFNNTSSATMLQTASSDVQLNTSQVENASVDDSIWLKEKWNPGEIPEEAPPDRFIR
ncbi:zinc finger CCCH domain-containing protein 16-like [Vicia villosa]|uniref:zinc finger CCCH domain-containing protein 16-like n=1 Tax=Vicia villosa TaxID=3911 RepID=UPI00273A7D48|nr:zinc finger CCCH domain-containing protein 16-like [Vicia villosa]